MYIILVNNTYTRPIIDTLTEGKNSATDQNIQFPYYKLKNMYKSQSLVNNTLYSPEGTSKKGRESTTGEAVSYPSQASVLEPVPTSPGRQVAVEASEGRVTNGATQPEEEEEEDEEDLASCRYTSRRTGSAGLHSNGPAKRATPSPKQWERGAGAVGDSKQERELLSRVIPTVPMANTCDSLSL